MNLFCTFLWNSKDSKTDLNFIKLCGTGNSSKKDSNDISEMLMNGLTDICVTYEI